MIALNKRLIQKVKYHDDDVHTDTRTQDVIIMNWLWWRSTTRTQDIIIIMNWLWWPTRTQDIIIMNWL